MNARRSRLDRLLGKLLGISRDDVRLLLARGRVLVNGEAVHDRDMLVDGFHLITIDGRAVQSGKAIYLMLHKPRGVLSATVDSRHPVVSDLVRHAALPQLHIAGRLDLHASGMLLLTNDGRWSRHLSSPDSGVHKLYEVTVQNPLDESCVKAFQDGMYFPYEDITTRPARLEITGTHTARVSLQEGRYHQLKRMFGRFRNPVLGIHRLATGSLYLDAALAAGAWRELTAQEVHAACSNEQPT